MTVRGALVAITITCLLLVSSASTAAAATGLQLSWDGHRWQPALSRPMFDPEVRWVPGDVRTASFWVRNATGRDTELTVAVLATGPDPDLAGVLALSASIDRGDRTGATEASRVQLAGNGTDRRLGSLLSSSVVRVTVVARFPAAATNNSQTDRTRLRFRITLTDARAGLPTPSRPPSGPDRAGQAPAGPGNGGSGSDRGQLPATGGPPWVWLLVGAISAAAGVALVRTARTRTGER